MEMKDLDLTKYSNKIDKIADIITKNEEEIFINSLRLNAEPPVKGEITKGKLKWRGIKICEKNDIFKYSIWLEQRGKQISEKIIIDFFY